MANWEVVAVTSDRDGNVSEAHWRHGNAYGSVDVSGTAADDFVALVKTAFGVERVALIEAQEALRVAKAAVPDVLIVPPAKLVEVLAAKPEQAKIDAVIAAVAAVEVAEVAHKVKEEAEQAIKQSEMEAEQAIKQAEMEAEQATKQAEMEVEMVVKQAEMEVKK